MRARPTHAVVSLAALDLRRRPEHRSEMRSQLLMGEVVRLVRSEAQAAWWLVEVGPERYRGWARAWGLIPASRARAERWRRLATATVSAGHAIVRERPARGAQVSPLFWRGHVIPGPIQGRFRRVELPDGRRGWVAREALAPARAGAAGLLERIQSLMGAPYLWGGRTPHGFDCSGFVQLLLGEHGLTLPRDAHDQSRVCAPIPRGEEPQFGDLAFFGPPRARVSHVALCLGGGYLAHARGQVRINSLDPSNPLCDKALTAQLRGFGNPEKLVSVS
jgi:cell wall-associated NlpC family hydrolase